MRCSLLLLFCCGLGHALARQYDAGLRAEILSVLGGGGERSSRPEQVAFGSCVRVRGGGEVIEEGELPVNATTANATTSNATSADGPQEEVKGYLQVLLDGSDTLQRGVELYIENRKKRRKQQRQEQQQKKNQQGGEGEGEREEGDEDMQQDDDNDDEDHDEEEEELLRKLEATAVKAQSALKATGETAGRWRDMLWRTTEGTKQVDYGAVLSSADKLSDRAKAFQTEQGDRYTSFLGKHLSGKVSPSIKSWTRKAVQRIVNKAVPQPSERAMEFSLLAANLTAEVVRDHLECPELNTASEEELMGAFVVYVENMEDSVRAYYLAGETKVGSVAGKLVSALTSYDLETGKKEVLQLLEARMLPRVLLPLFAAELYGFDPRQEPWIVAFVAAFAVGSVSELVLNNVVRVLQEFLRKGETLASGRGRTRKRRRDWWFFGRGGGRREDGRQGEGLSEAEAKEVYSKATVGFLQVAPHGGGQGEGDTDAGLDGDIGKEIAHSALIFFALLRARLPLKEEQEKQLVIYPQQEEGAEVVVVAVEEEDKEQKAEEEEDVPLLLMGHLLERSELTSAGKLLLSVLRGFETKPVRKYSRSIGRKAPTYMWGGWFSMKDE